MSGSLSSTYILFCVWCISADQVSKRIPPAVQGPVPPEAAPLPRAPQVVALVGFGTCGLPCPCQYPAKFLPFRGYERTIAASRARSPIYLVCRTKRKSSVVTQRRRSRAPLFLGTPPGVPGAAAIFFCGDSLGDGFAWRLFLATSRQGYLCHGCRFHL